MQRFLTTAVLALAAWAALELLMPTAAQANPYYTPAGVYSAPVYYPGYNYSYYRPAYPTAYYSPYSPAYVGPRFYIPQYFSPSGSYYYTPGYYATPGYYTAPSYYYYYTPARRR